MSTLHEAVEEHLGQYRSQGCTAHGNYYFNAPLISEITPDLWVGGVRDGAFLPGFNTVFSLFKYEKYDLAPRTDQIDLDWDDGNEVPEDLDEHAKAVNFARQQGPVLVHCQAGLNRSALLAARAMVLNHDVVFAEEAIDELRSKRSPAVLCNQTFETYLRVHDA